MPPPSLTLPSWAVDEAILDHIEALVPPDTNQGAITLMPFKLTKDQQAEANSLATLAWDAHSELNEAIVEAAGLANPTEAKPALTAETKANLEILRHVLVDRVQDCTAFAQRLGDEWRNEWNEKSERWQEGENGSKAEDFISEWENFEPDVEELDWNDLAEIDPGPIEDFEALPESA